MDENRQQQQLKEITEKLEQGVQELFTSEKYTEYLRVMSQFHNYSFSNTLLIALQKPDATWVASYGTWQKKFERHVNRGEKAIKIFAPAPRKIQVEQEKLDPHTKRPVFDENGEPVTETVTIQKPYFKIVSVFDYAQTDGKPLPELAEVRDLTSNVEEYEMFFEALRRTSNVPIAFEDIEGGSHGYYHQVEKRIAIASGMSEAQNIKTLIHEIAHERQYGSDMLEAADGKIVDKNTREVMAESIAYTLCSYYSISPDVGEYSFGYISAWSSGKDMKELRASMEVIRKEANSMITEIDGHLDDIRKEREQDRQLTAESVQQDAEYAFKVGDKFFTIQQVEDGYDYTFYDANLKELDGGVYDNPDITITGAMKEILKGEGLSLEDCRSISYKDFMEQKTSLDLQQGNELNGLNRSGIEETALNYAQSELMEMGVEQDIQLLGASVYGSRSRKGLSTPESDIDVVLSYSGDISEDSFFNILHEHEMKIGGMTLDINPISLEKTGTLEDYLKQADKYLDEKEIQKFAADLDAFAYRLDAYGYKDVIDNSDDSGIGAEAIRKDLMNGKIAPLREWLQELASGSVWVEDVVTAAQLWDRLEKIAEKQSEQTQPVPVYQLSFMEAQERGETDQWRASHWETKACAMEFNQDFGMAYHERRMPEFLQQMVDKYGMERCKIVLASTIQLADHDGRYYPSTKEEAAKVSIPNVDTSNENDRRLDYRADCHPVMVNSAFRELLTMEQEQSQEKAMSVIEQDEKAPPKSVLNRLREKQKQVASQKEKPARVQDKKRGVEL